MSRLLCLALLCSMGFCGAALGAADADPLFRSDALLEVSISGPLRALSGDESDEPEAHPGRFAFTDDDGVSLELAVGLRPRGKSRRKGNVCTFPPLWINFEKKAVKGTLLENQNRVKLVTHCKPSSRYEQHLLREYLAYRVLNIVTDRSFRVRLLHIEYQDDTSDDAPFAKYGFLIEHQKRLGERLGVTYTKSDAVARGALQADYASVVELFQYLLGNVDFSLIAGPEGEECCHNAKLFSTADGSILSIPYDFDMSGFVDPPYGFPNRELRQRSLGQRVYRGFCRPGDAHLKAVARFQEKRPEIIALIRDQPQLDERVRRQVAKFVDDFYDVLDNPKKLQKRVLEACR